MSDILETWMPFQQFEQAYPQYRHCYYVKINDCIVFYEVRDAPCKLYFTLEDAYASIGKKGQK